MATLLNTETQGQEEIPQDEVQKSLDSGKYDIPKGTDVNVVNPDGKVVTLPSDSVYDAVNKHGYKIPGSGDIKNAENEQEFGEGFGPTAKAFGAGLLRGPTIGASDVALTQTGAVNPETLKQLKERHPYASMAGEVTGIGASLLVPAIRAVGLGSGLAVGALGRGAASIAARAGAGELGTLALGSSLEAAVYGAGQVVTETQLGDPEMNAQKALATIGLSGVLGGVLGPVVGKATEYASGKIDNVLAAIKGDVTQSGIVEAQKGLKGSLDQIAIPETQKQSIMEGLTNLKGNAKEIEDAAKDIGAPVLESQISSSKHVQDLDSMLMQSPTPVGVARQQLYQQGVDAANHAVGSVLETGTNLSKAETGNAIKQGLVDAFEKETKPISDMYNVLKSKYKEVPLEKEDIGTIAKNIMNIEDIGLSKSSPEYKLASNVADEIPGLQTVDQVKSYRTIVRRRTAGVPELRYIGGKIDGELAKLEENSVFNFAKSKVENPEQAQALVEAIGMRQQANTKYKELIGKMGEVGEIIGKKKIYGPQNFLDFVQDIVPEKLTDKLYAKNNSEFMGFFKERFPEQAKILLDYQKNTIKSAAMSDGGINANKVLRDINKMSPELKNIVFDEAQIKKLNSANTYIEAMPKNINPSGTSKSEAYRRYFEHPTGQILGTVKDLTALAQIKALVSKTGGSDAAATNTLINMERSFIKTANTINKSAKQVFEPLTGYAASKAAESLVNDKGRYKKVTDKINDHASNPTKMIDMLQANLSPMRDHAPDITSSLEQQASLATSFLASKIPTNPGPKLPFSPKYEPAQSEIAKFDRYYQVVENPLSVMKDLRTGTIGSEAIETLGTVYPKLYDQMKQAILSSVTDKLAKDPDAVIPYKTKMTLSVFLGQDLDSSLSQVNIAANQATLAHIAQKNDAKEAMAQGAVRSTQKGLSNLTASSRIETAMQSNSQRERG